MLPWACTRPAAIASLRPDPLGSDESVRGTPPLEPEGDVEHPGQIGVVDTDAGVNDARPGPVLVVAQCQLDSSAVRSVRDRVGHQIRQHAYQRPVAAAYPWPPCPRRFLTMPVKDDAARWLAETAKAYLDGTVGATLKSAKLLLCRRFRR